MGQDVWTNTAAKKIEAYRTDTQDLGINYYYGQDSQVSHFQQLYCWAKIGHSQAMSVCKSLGPELSTNNSYIRHLIQ